MILVNRSRVAASPGDPHVASASADWHRSLLAAAALFQLGVLPVLWNEATFAPSVLWTSIGAALMIAAIVSDHATTQTDRRLYRLTLAFVIGYPLLCLLSYLWSDHASPARLGLLPTNAMLMALGLLYFLFGAAIARHPFSAGLPAALVVASVYGLAERASFSPQEIYERLMYDGFRVDYQYLGDAFVLCGLMVLPRVRSMGSRLLFTAPCVVVMFTIPSRSAAFFGALALVFGLFLGARAWGRLIVGTAMTALFVGYQLLPLEEWFSNTRFETILTGGDDTSIDLRSRILSHGLRVISEKPLLGEWAFQVDALGSRGLYVHNALDLWAQGGILAFALFVALWVVALHRCFELWQRDPRAGNACAPLLLFAGLSWAFSRNAAYVLLFLSLGYLAGMVGRRQALDHESDPSTGIADGAPERAVA
ncbi:MAG: hypothetical protein QM674_09290 [Burkholderiaceae bacterium]